MKLYVMRHGPAQDDSPSGRDADRALTPAGRERVAAVAKALVAEGEAPFSILSSPLVRAMETAEIVADVTHLSRRAREDQKAQRGGATGEIEIRRELGMGTEKLALVAELVRAGRKRVMIVGHEPDLSMLVMSLVGADLPGGMGKGMVVGVKVTPDPQVAGLEFRSTLKFVLDPKSLVWQRH
ncbi:MAG: phosphohistidine phosphatase, SixA [Labilithrix sp.]|nr:phosphohistidine phosphatase, SixA [Labilithrix sp.]